MEELKAMIKKQGHKHEEVKGKFFNNEEGEQASGFKSID